MTSFRGFTVLSILTVVLASAAFEASRFGFADPRLIVVFAVVYSLAVYLRERLYRSEVTFFDADHGMQQEEEALIVFGHEIEDLAKESVERRLLVDLTDSKDKIRIYFSWVACVVLAILLQSRIRGLTTLDVIVPVLIVTSICFAPFLAQLLVPVAVSLVLSLTAIAKSDSLSVSFYFVLFAISFFLTLLMYREVTPDRINQKRETKLPVILKTSFAVTAMFIGFYFLFDFVIPEQNPFKSAVTPPVRKRSKFSTDNLSREVAEQVVKFQERNRGDRENTSHEPSTTVRDDHRPPQFTPPSGRGEFEPSGTSDDARSPGTPSGSGHGDPQHDMTSREMKGGSDNKDGTTERGLDPIRDSSRDQRPDAQPDQNPEAKTEAKLDTKPDANSGKQGPSAERSLNQGERSTAEPGGSTDSSTAPDGSGRDGRTTGDKNAADAPSRGAGSDKPVASDTKAHEKKVEELKRKLEMPFDISKGILVLIAAALGNPVLLKLLARLKKPTNDEPKLQQLSARQKKKLQTILNQIRERRLPPEAEVIETYNALLAVFEMGHHAREDWLPAEDFSTKIRSEIPPVATPFSGATSRFSRTLYGKKSVEPEDLKIFREEVRTVLRFFQLN